MAADRDRALDALNPPRVPAAHADHAAHALTAHSEPAAASPARATPLPALGAAGASAPGTAASSSRTGGASHASSAHTRCSATGGQVAAPGFPAAHGPAHAGKRNVRWRVWTAPPHEAGHGCHGCHSLTEPASTHAAGGACSRALDAGMRAGVREPVGADGMA